MNDVSVSIKAPLLGVRREQQLWRERTLRGVALTMAPCFAAVALWFRLVDNPVQELFAVLMSAALALAAVAVLQSLPFVVRTALTLGALYVSAVATILRVGFSPNPFLVLGLICFLGTLLIGRNAGLGLVGACTVTVLAIGYAHGTHLVERTQDWALLMDDTIAANTLRVVLTFGLVTTVLITAVSYVLNRSQELAVEKEQSLETLRREQAERERIGRDLELREAAFQKGRELELLGRLAGSMAHDFNNALLVIWVALDELALLPGLPQAAGTPLADLRSAADHAFATTKQLRAFGPMAPSRPSAINLTPLLEKAIAMFLRVLPQNIRLESDLRLDATLLADEGDVMRVLMNLALNARDAMRDGGKLVLRVRPPTPEERLLPLPAKATATRDVPAAVGVAVLEVEDTGSGMSEAVKSRIFEPFFTTKQASGTGLGLASVRDLVVAHGGRIELSSEPGAGTTVTLLWPSIEPASERAPVPSPLRSSEPAVVLLVDDDDAVRLALRRSLTRAGMTVLDAADGATALTLARRHQAPIQLLCTDCMMPGPPVRQLINGFRELHPGRVLICSGYAPDETGLTPEVFDDFLPKPFSGETLVARVHAVLSAARC